MDTSIKPYEGLDNVFVVGEWREGRAGKSREDKNPYTGETLVEIPLANAEDLDEAYRASERAQRECAAMLPRERRDVIGRACAILGVYPLQERGCSWSLQWGFCSSCWGLWAWLTAFMRSRGVAGIRREGVWAPSPSTSSTPWRASGC